MAAVPSTAAISLNLREVRPADSATGNHVDCYARGREATAPAGNEARK
jgi:hypothetical protein